jgi:hypothetical protein
MVNVKFEPSRLKDAYLTDAYEKLMKSKKEIDVSAIDFSFKNSPLHYRETEQ